MQQQVSVNSGQQQVALWGSTFAFTVCFAVWTIFSIIGIQIKKDLGLNDTQFGLLVGHTDPDRLADPPGPRHLDRPVSAAASSSRWRMLCAAAATWLLTYATTYPQLSVRRAAVGIAGGSFAVGVAYVSKWFPARRSRAPRWASSAPAMSAPRSPSWSRRWCMVAYGWQTVAQVWAVGAGGHRGLFFLFTKDDPRPGPARAPASSPSRSLKQIEAAEESPGLALLRSTTSSCSAPSSRWRCGCRAT